MLSSVSFSGVDVLLIFPLFYGVENPRFVAVHFQDRFDVLHLIGLMWSYPPYLIPNFLLFARVFSPLIICVLKGGLIPSSNTGLCVILRIAFWCTFIFVDPSSFRHMHVSRKASVLFSYASTGNLMLSSMEFRCCRNCSTSLSRCMEDGVLP